MDKQKKGQTFAVSSPRNHIIIENFNLTICLEPTGIRIQPMCWFTPAPEFTTIYAMPFTFSLAVSPCPKNVKIRRDNLDLEEKSFNKDLDRKYLHEKGRIVWRSLNFDNNYQNGGSYTLT